MPRLQRSQVPSDLTFNLDDIYPDLAAWEDDVHQVDAAIPGLAASRGRLGVNATSLLDFLQARDAVLERLDKIIAFAQLRVSADGTDPRNQSLQAGASALQARLVAAIAFVADELLALPEGRVMSFLADEPGLEPYRYQFGHVLRRRGHVLAPDAERILELLGPVLKAPYTVWQRATSADLVCESVDDSGGERAPVSIGRWQWGLAEHSDRTVRRRAYESLYAGLERYTNTLAATLGAHVQRNAILARARGFDSAAEMILASRHVPVDVYRLLMDEVHDGMAPPMRRLVRLRKRALGLEAAYLYDLKAPLDSTFDPPISFADAERLIAEGLAILGDDYAAVLRSAFRDRWIDRADNVGKFGGVFAWPVYRLHPYVFLNWRDNLRNVFVLAHELGHAGHGVLSGRDQAVSNALSFAQGIVASFPYFFTEAPSTANELLLGQHLLATTTDARMRGFVLEQFLGTFIHNLVTHMLEAHFEQRLYDLADAGRPITTQAVLDAQGEVFERFYGGEVVVDDHARRYWMEQPHFYSELLPHSYAAGLACAAEATTRIRAEGQPAIERWLNTLRLGASRSSLDLARHAGVDMTRPEPVRRAVAWFSSLVDELERSFDGSFTGQTSARSI
jgi:oligoendopeptidase F